MTSQTQVTEAKQIAVELQEAICKTGVEVVVNVDDWSDDASFRLFITFKITYPTSQRDINLRKLGWLIKQVIKKHPLAIIQFVEMPKRIYWSDYGRKVFDGYQNDYIMMDMRVIERA